MFAASLLACDGGGEPQSPISITFESEGMRLSLEELIRSDDVVWAMDFIDSSTMIFTERKGRLMLLDLETNEASRN